MERRTSAGWGRSAGEAPARAAAPAAGFDRADVDEVSGTSGRGLAKEANQLSISIHFENDE